MKKTTIKHLAGGSILAVTLLFSSIPVAAQELIQSESIKRDLSGVLVDKETGKPLFRNMPFTENRQKTENNKSHHQTEDDIPVNTVVDEDFIYFTAGTEDEPDSELIGDSDWNIPDSYFHQSGWTGTGVQQAGGTCALAYPNYGGCINTPMGDYQGTVNIKFRVKALSTNRYDKVSFTVGLCYDEYAAHIIEYKRIEAYKGVWTEYELTYISTYGGLDAFVQINSYDYIIIDDVKVTKQQNYIAEPALKSASDFTYNGFTANWGEDGLQPSVDMVTLGFEIGTPWIVVEDNGNPVACSTSWYQPAGTSNDWLITRDFIVNDENATLTWIARAYDKDYSDGYAVYVSETGNTVADFDITSPLFLVASEKNKWTRHRLSLASYRGKKIWLAFVNNSTDMSRLYIDNIRAGVEPDVYIASNASRITSFTGATDISVTVHTEKDEPVSNFTIGIEYNGQTYTEYFERILNPDEPVKLTLEHKPVIGRNETINYRLWVQSGSELMEISNELTCYVKGVVCDEFTGTWCQYCPRGIVAMKKMADEYPDNFLGIAVHVSDIMYCGEYYNEISHRVNINGYPYFMMARDKSKVGDPNLIETYFKKTVNEDPVAGMDVKTEYNETLNQIKVETDLWFIEDYEEADYRLTYILIENNVHQPGNSDYNQNNAYSGGNLGEMGGFEDLPFVIPADQMYYQDVVRGYFGDFNGMEGSIPSVIEAGKQISYDFSFEMPENVLVSDNTEVIVLLIDGNNQAINGMKAEIRTGSTGLINVSDMNNDAIEVGRYSVDGVRVGENYKGIVLIKYSDGSVRKILSQPGF